MNFLSIQNAVLSFAFLTVSSIFGSAPQIQSPTKYNFVGPLLTPNPAQLPLNHPALESTIYTTHTLGTYTRSGKINRSSKMQTVGPYFDFQQSLNDWLGYEIIASSSTNFKSEKVATHLNDTIFRLGFQISRDCENSWVPDFRILFQEIFPTGKYQRGNPTKLGIDLTGQGSYRTGAHLALQKIFNEITRHHSLGIRFTVGYFYPSSVTVKGLSSYGGTINTHGKVFPGSYFISYLTTEYSLNKHWAICLETIYQIGNKGKFKNFIVTESSIEIPSFMQFSMAPELQYSISDNLGLLFGTWFSVYGQNTSAFMTFFSSVLYVF